MSYHSLTQDSGGTENDRVNEARRIVKILNEDVGLEIMSQKEQDFIGQMEECDSCTTKQLFYLRDIKDRYL